MTWTPVDCHAHTTMSDGELGVAELAATVRVRGARPSVADHLSRDVARAVDSLEKVRTYLDTLDAHDVLRGGEFCWHDALWRELPDEIWDRFTHRIGSLHAVRLADGRSQHAFAPRLPDGLAPAAYMDAHLDDLERMTREMPVDILAHPTLVPIPLRTLPPEELWTERHEERMVAALAASGIRFELSNRYRAHERLVRRAAAAGVGFSLGSDGHTRAQVGDLAWPLALARQLGVRDDDLYDPAVHGRRAA